MQNPTVAIVAAIGLLTASCASEDVGVSRATIGGGAASDNASVVAVLDTSRGNLCSGMVVGPHEVLTTRSCVTTDGTPTGALSILPNLHVIVGNAVSGDSVGVTEVLESGATDQADVAILRTDVALEAPGLPLALALPAVDDVVTIVGYGQTASGGSGVRSEGTARVAMLMGDGIGFLTDGDAGTCQGDAGGPALDAAGNVVGVGYFGVGSLCPVTQSGFRGVVDIRAFVEASLTTPIPDAGLRDAGGDASGDTSDPAASDSGCTVARASGRGSPKAGWALVLVALLVRRRRRLPPAA